MGSSRMQAMGRRDKQQTDGGPTSNQHWWFGEAGVYQSHSERDTICMRRGVIGYRAGWFRACVLWSMPHAGVCGVCRERRDPHTQGFRTLQISRLTSIKCLYLARDSLMSMWRVRPRLYYSSHCQCGFICPHSTAALATIGLRVSAY